MNKSFLSLSIILFSASAALAQTLNITPGELAGKLPGVSGPKVVITGKGDVRDLMLLRSLPAEVESVDLSATGIVAHMATSPAYLGRAHFKDNQLPSYIFFKAKFRNIMMPSGINSIEEGAFSGAEINEIVIPEGVTEIGDFAFYGCPNLKSVILPTSLNTIGKGAFANCTALTEINIADTRLSAIPDEAFAGCTSLSTLNLSNIMAVGSKAFRNTAVSELLLPSATYLAPYALADMSALREVVINSSARFSEGTLMNNSRLVAVEGIPTDIPALFAANCTAYIPKNAVENASSIGDYALAGTSMTSELILSGNLTYIAKDIFKDTRNLEEIDATALEGNIPAADEDAFASLVHSDIKVRVDDNSFDLWAADPVWSQFHIYSENHSTSVDSPIDTANEISVSLIGNEIAISSSHPLKFAAIYDTAGTLLRNLPAGETDIRVSTENLPAGILIVKAAAGGSAKSVKIIR